MIVTVIGATGRIGKRVAAMLAQDGHDVRGVNRRPDRAATILAQTNVRTYTADAADESALTPALAGAETAVLATAPAELYPYGEVTRSYRVATDVLVVTDPANPNFKETSVLSMEDLAAFITDEVEHPTRHRQLVTLAY